MWAITCLRCNCRHRMFAAGLVTVLNIVIQLQGKSHIKFISEMFKLKSGPVNVSQMVLEQSFLCHVLGHNYVLETEEMFPEKQPIHVLPLSCSQMSVQVSQH